MKTVAGDVSSIFFRITTIWNEYEMGRFLVIILLLLGAYKLGSMDIFAPSSKLQFIDERLVPFVQQMPRNPVGPSYWLEVESLVGWEKAILIFGYADDFDVCNQLLKASSLEAPARRFKCTPVN
jgi:hypothetical protein